MEHINVIYIFMPAIYMVHMSMAQLLPEIHTDVLIYMIILDFNWVLKLAFTNCTYEMSVYLARYIHTYNIYMGETHTYMGGYRWIQHFCSHYIEIRNQIFFHHVSLTVFCCNSLKFLITNSINPTTRRNTLAPCRSTQT